MNDNATPRRKRSPAHPTRRLSESIAQARVLHQQFGDMPQPREVFGQAVTGPPARVLATLRYYGLVSRFGTKGELQLTDLARALVTEPATPEALFDATRRAAFHPKAFSMFVRDFGLCPDREAVTATLQQRGFNPIAAVRAAKLHADNMAYLRSMTRAPAVVPAVPEQDRARPADEAGPVFVAARQPMSTTLYTWLDRTTDVEVRARRPLTAAHWRHLKANVQIMIDYLTVVEAEAGQPDERRT